jgi:glutamine cyclotransferase
MLVRTHYLRGLCLRFTFIISLLSSGYANAVPIYSYRVVATYPHSTDSYTEGFFYLDGMFYEGIGINGRSRPSA